MKGFLQPKDADPRIVRWTAPHYLHRNERVADAHLLCLILPGTGGLPRDYRKLADQAADLGMHALALRYPNDVSINELADADLSLHGPLRESVLDGVSRAGRDGLPAGESLLERLLSVLALAVRTRRNEDWGQFLSEGRIAWERVVVVGHSLGGGYAAMLAKRHEVERVVCLGWADWDRTQGRIASWIGEGAWATAPGRRFAMIHRRDEMVPERVAREVLGILCPDAVEAVVDSGEPPYGRARLLVTDLDPAREVATASPFHNSLAIDVEHPRFWDGANMLADAWTWLLIGR